MNSFQTTRAVVFAVLSTGLTLSSPALAEENIWRVAKSSGEVWMAHGEFQPASLASEMVLHPGDNVRTGRNGRVLLVRGQEQIMVAPNSAIGIPTSNTAGLETTIIQQAGSILLDVEKKNVQHFEVETPYLAAVVKGTQFRVTISNERTHVEVMRGQVDVSDFKTGEHALVLPGQSAGIQLHGRPGLTMGGSGKFNPVQAGAPRPSLVRPISIPRAGLTPPATGEAPNKKAVQAAGGRAASRDVASEHRSSQNISRSGSLVRIGAPIGQMKLDFQRTTHGLARGAGQSNGNQNTVWKTGVMNSETAATGFSNGNSGSDAAVGTVGVSAAASKAAVSSTASGASIAASINASGSGSSLGNASNTGSLTTGGNADGSNSASGTTTGKSAAGGHGTTVATNPSRGNDKGNNGNGNGNGGSHSSSKSSGDDSSGKSNGNGEGNSGNGKGNGGSNGRKS